MHRPDRRQWAALLAIPVAALAVGCSSSSSEADEPQSEPTTAAPTTSTASAGAACFAPRPIDDPDLAAFVAGLQLPPGVQVVTGRVSTDSDYPGQVGVAIDLCLPDSSDADSLRPVATDIAHALRPSPLGERTFALYVADMDGSYNTEAKIKDPDFQVNLWNGKPSRNSELARWEVVTG